MTSTMYQDYLQSPEWKQKARTRIQIDGGRCVMCGSMGTTVNPLHVHHLGYRNVGNEDPYTDLMTLCKSCHRQIHKAMSRCTAVDQYGNKKYGWKSDIPNYNQHVLDLSENGQIETIQ